MANSSAWYSKISRATLENVALYISCVVIYLFSLGTVPPKLELFEEWVDNYLPILSQSWQQQLEAFGQVGHNDSNCSVNAPFWLLLVQTSFTIFGKTIFAYRLPTVLLTSLAPVFVAELVRRFFRRDIAILVGLLVATQQHVMWFGRTGGYIGPTLALFTGILLASFIIALENKRTAWIWLALGIALSPYFYSTIRYYILIPFAIIAYQFIVSKDFRKRHVLPLCGFVAFNLIASIPLARQGIGTAAVFFISGRGEQFLLSERMINEGIEAESIPAKYRMSGVFTEIIPERLNDLDNFYFKGGRFFTPRHQQMHYETAWLPLKKWLLGGFALGLVFCLISAWRQRRYLVFPAWSIWGWIPLLVTTGISPNRMLLAAPADFTMIALGAFGVLDTLGRFAPAKIVVGLKLLLWGAFLSWCYYSATMYFADYIAMPNI